MITWNTDVNAPCCHGEIVNEDGLTVLVQTDWDYPSVASTFGWDMADVQPDPATWHFNRFHLTLPREAAEDCHHQGDCHSDVQGWASDIDRPDDCTPEALRAELADYGAWDDNELADDSANWERIIWIAAGNIQENPCIHDGTDGTIDCPECGVTASEFITAAGEWLRDNDGATADDPGYFDGDDD